MLERRASIDLATTEQGSESSKTCREVVECEIKACMMDPQQAAIESTISSYESIHLITAIAAMMLGT